MTFAAASKIIAQEWGAMGVCDKQSIRRCMKKTKCLRKGAEGIDLLKPTEQKKANRREYFETFEQWLCKRKSDWRQLPQKSAEQPVAPRQTQDMTHPRAIRKECLPV